MCINIIVRIMCVSTNWFAAHTHAHAFSLYHLSCNYTRILFPHFAHTLHWPAIVNCTHTHIGNNDFIWNNLFNNKVIKSLTIELQQVIYIYYVIDIIIHISLCIFTAGIIYGKLVSIKSKPFIYALSRATLPPYIIMNVWTRTVPIYRYRRSCHNSEDMDTYINRPIKCNWTNWNNRRLDTFVGRSCHVIMTRILYMKIE